MEIQRSNAGQQFIENYAERVDVGAGVHVSSRGVGLLRTHVGRRGENCARLGEQDFRLLRHGFGYAEIDDTQHGFAIDFAYQNVRWLQIAMYDGFLMGVLDSFTYLNEQLKALADAQFMLIAVSRDGNAVMYSIAK